MIDTLMRWFKRDALIDTMIKPPRPIFTGYDQRRAEVGKARSHTQTQADPNVLKATLQGER